MTSPTIARARSASTAAQEARARAQAADAAARALEQEQAAAAAAADAEERARELAAAQHFTDTYGERVAALDVAGAFAGIDAAVRASDIGAAFAAYLRWVHAMAAENALHDRRGLAFHVLGQPERAARYAADSRPWPAGEGISSFDTVVRKLIHEQVTIAHRATGAQFRDRLDTAG